MEECPQSSNDHSQYLKIITFFLQRTDNTKPILPSEIPITQLLREYLNDDDFIIFSNESPIFTNQKEMERLTVLFNDWTSKIQNKDIDEFIVFWINHVEGLQIRYSLYQDINKLGEVTEYNCKKRWEDLEKSSSSMMLKEQNPCKVKDKLIKITSQLTPHDYLSRFFIFYSKKQVNNNKNQTFNKVQQYFNALNLTKWMLYCRDVGLNKMNKKVNNQKLKELFLSKQNQKRQLDLQRFENAVNQALILALNSKEKVQQQGYSIIGIKDQESFQRKFRDMGEIVPIYCLKKKKQKLITEQATSKRTLQSKNSVIPRLKMNNIKADSDQLSLSNIKNSLPLLKDNNYRLSVPLKNSILQNSKLSSKLHNNSQQLSISTISDNKMSCMFNKRHIKQRDELLASLINEPEDDPYLKRYNHKENIQRYKFIANRIDERIEKLQQKS